MLGGRGNNGQIRSVGRSAARMLNPSLGGNLIIRCAIRPSCTYLVPVRSLPSLLDMLASIACLVVAFSSVLAGFISDSPQVALNAPSPPHSTIANPAYNFTTLHLSSITGDDTFTALRHPRFPAHQVRVKKSNFCDPTVKLVRVHDATAPHD